MRLPRPLSYLFRRMLHGAPGSLFPLGADNIEAELPPPTADGQTIVANLSLPNKMAWGDAGAAVGHWTILCDGDDADPQPVYVENADGVNDFLEVWVVP